MSNMARTMEAEDAVVVRAVVRVHGKYAPSYNGAEPREIDRTEIYGPYRTTAPARAAITRARDRWGWRDGVTVDGTVQVAALVWEDVE